MFRVWPKQLAGVALGGVVLVLALLFGQRPAGADEGLAVVSEITYSPVVEDGFVDVEASFEITNIRANAATGSTTTRYFYREFVVWVHEGYEDLVVSGGGRRLSAEVEADPEVTGWLRARIQLPSELNYGQVQTVTLGYRLPGAEPRSERIDRINASTIVLPIWMCCDYGSTTIRVLVPPRFFMNTTTDDDAMFTTQTEDERVYRVATGIDVADDRYLVVRGNDPSEQARPAERVEVGQDVQATIRSWEGDAAWEQFVRSNLEEDLPVLEDLIGLDWPEEAELEVVQSLGPFMAGYGGWYDKGRIEIGEELNRSRLAHELSHAWFNDELFGGRWITEGLAEEFASRAIERNEGVLPDIEPPDGAFADAVALSIWAQPPQLASERAQIRESFHYASSWWVMRQLTEEVGVEGVAAVIGAAANDEISFIGEGPPEVFDGHDDWRRFLDLAEERAGSTGFEAIVRSHVALPSHVVLLDQRRAVHEEFDVLVERSGGWAAPLGVREKLTAWAFADATMLIEASNEVLTVRDRLDRLADNLDLPVTPELELAFESAVTAGDLVEALEMASARVADFESIANQRADAFVELTERRRDVENTAAAAGLEPPKWETSLLPSGVDAATADAKDLLVVLSVLDDAGRTAAADRSMVVRIGLWREQQPQLLVESGRRAFEAGDYERARMAGTSVDLSLAEAEERGRQRMLWMLGVGGLVLVSAVAALFIRRWRAAG